MGYARYFLSIAKPQFNEAADQSAGYCTVCGKDGVTFAFAMGINDDLARQWELSERQRYVYSARETRHCSNCNASLRARTMAQAIIDTLAPDESSLEAAIASHKLDKLKIAEINANNFLHDRLAILPQLQYSEYEPKDPSIRHENLEQLSYADNTFDVVLTSETLEHIPHYQTALQEIHRILKPGGKHIFTVPIIFNRASRRRVVINDGEVTETLEGSYHGAGEPDNLVCTEFGIDFLDDLRAARFATKILYANPLSLKSINCVFVSRALE